MIFWLRKDKDKYKDKDRQHDKNLPKRHNKQLCQMIYVHASSFFIRTKPTWFQLLVEIFWKTICAFCVRNKKKRLCNISACFSRESDIVILCFLFPSSCNKDCLTSHLIPRQLHDTWLFPRPTFLFTPSLFSIKHHNDKIIFLFLVINKHTRCAFKSSCNVSIAFHFSANIIGDKISGGVWLMEKNCLPP